MHDIQFELLTRPPDETAVSLAAQRLQIRLTDRRRGTIHDHRAHRDPMRSAAVTRTPPSAPWALNTDELWARVEWTERHGPSPLLFELRAVLPNHVDEPAARDLARDLADFVCRDLNTPVSYVILDGRSRWMLRDDAGRHIRLCFPTRAVASENGTATILDRSGRPSGFVGRLAMAGTPRLANAFVGRVAHEFSRLLQEPQDACRNPSMALSAMEAAAASTNLGLESVFGDLAGVPEATHKAAGGSLEQGPLPTVMSTRTKSDDEGPVDTEALTHPIVARLRREAPRGGSSADERDLEMALGYARSVEDALNRVGAVNQGCQTAAEHLRRTKAEALDQAFLLDQMYRRRDLAISESLSERAGISVLWSGRKRLMRRRQASKDRARVEGHIRDLKHTISRLRRDVRRSAQAVDTAELGLRVGQGELKDAVRILEGRDPRVLMHMLGILTGPERQNLKTAMARPGDESGASGEGDGGNGKAGPPSKVTPSSRNGARLSRR